MRNQATKLDLIDKQRDRRHARIEALICIPLAIFIAGSYAYLGYGLFVGNDHNQNTREIHAP